MIVIQEGPIDVAALIAHVQGPDHGGLTLFLGSTRDTEAGAEVLGLEYEGYLELAVSETARICAETVSRFGARVAVGHRLGYVPAGEPSVAVAASTAHRSESFAACRYAIDEIKVRVPIWKRVIRADGQQVWGIPGSRA